MASGCEFHKCMIKSIKKWQMASVCELQNSKKKQQMALVCEFQKMYDKVYKKNCKWLHYINFKNLRKNLQMASLCKFQKSTKKPANGFSM